MPEIRPLVVTNPLPSGDNELTAARWDDTERAWIANDGRVFAGPPPEEADDLVVVMAEPTDKTELFEKTVEAAREPGGWVFD